MKHNSMKRWWRGLWPVPQFAIPAGAPQPEDVAVLMAEGDDDKKRTVKGTRRRKTGSSSEPRRQAQAPKRDDSPSAPPPRPPSGGQPPISYGGSGGSPPPQGGGFQLPSGGGLPGGGGGFSPAMLLGGIAVIGLLCIGAFLFLRPGGSGGGTPLLGGGESAGAPSSSGGGLDQIFSELQPAEQANAELSAPRPATNFEQPAVGEGEESWLIMLYQDADDKILEKDILVDLNEAERVGSTPNIRLVSQIDRYGGGYTGDGNWEDTRRFQLEYDPDLNRIGSRELMNVGEVNMASGDSLVDFVTWAVDEFPADKYVLIMSDHGMGWPGGWSDATNQGRGADNIALAAATGDQMFLMEIDRALEEIRSRTGVDKFELIGMDACLMGHVEVFEMLSPHARYAVASQEVEPALGWAYTGFLSELAANPDVTGRELGQHIVETYIEEDQRIQDDQARAEWTGRGFLGGPSKEQLTTQLSDDVTLTAVDLEKMPGVINALNDLAYVLQGEDQRVVAKARQYAQGFTSIWGRGVPASYLDLLNLISIIEQNSRNPQIQQASSNLRAAVEDAVVSERNGPKKPGATGMSVYFPNSDLYRNRAAGAQSYVEVADSFAENSVWDDFLAFHYTGRQFQQADRIVAAPPVEQVAAPGQGQITVSPLSLSDNEVQRGNTITLSADISGENIGYIKFFAGFLDEAANAIYIADTDYIDSGDTREVGGVYYPEWGEGDFTLEFEWEPIVFGVSNGPDFAEALFEPETYGATVDDAVYAVDGVYTYVDGSSYPARMYFNNSDGLMRDIYGFVGGAGAGAPREILPSNGDVFTVAEQWLELGQSGQPAERIVEQGRGITLTDQQPSWEVLDAAPGTYVVGYLVEDLDGNVYPVYAEVTVR